MQHQSLLPRGIGSWSIKGFGGDLPLKKNPKKQGKMLLPILSPTPCLNFTFYSCRAP